MARLLRGACARQVSTMLALTTVALAITGLTATSTSSDASLLKSHSQHWALRGPLPSGIVSISAFDCGSPRFCVAAGEVQAGPVMLSTTTGGAPWSESALPGASSLGLVQATTVTCGSATSCLALFLFSDRASCCDVFATTNAGKTWRYLAN